MPEDFAAARAAGIRTIVNNRPDGEALDQPSSAEAERLAREAGLAYVHIPVPNGGLTLGQVEAFARTLAEGEGPFLAYCRSGTRSCYLWALASARHTPVDEVIAGAARAGYDIRGARPLLERIAAEAQSTSQR